MGNEVVMPCDDMRLSFQINILRYRRTWRRYCLPQVPVINAPVSGEKGVVYARPACRVARHVPTDYGREVIAIYDLVTGPPLGALHRARCRRARR